MTWTKEPSEWQVLKAFIRSIRYFLLLVVVVFAPSIAAAVIRRNVPGLVLLAALLVLVLPVLMGLLYSLKRKDLKIQVMLGKEIERIGPAPVVKRQ